MNLIIEPARTDPAFRKACEAYANIKDVINSIFWWDAWKLKMFGQATLNRKHGRLLNRLHDYVKAIEASAIEGERLRMKEIQR